MFRRARIVIREHDVSSPSMHDGVMGYGLWVSELEDSGRRGIGDTPAGKLVASHVFLSLV